MPLVGRCSVWAMKWAIMFLASTTETDENSMVTTPGAINGGFFPKSQEGAAPYPSVVIDVDDINQTMKQINDAGGKQ